MLQYPKRLIEVDLPIARISAHARREKSIRHGHISTLPIWWARRPLAVCRAVVCASLWPDPADELCPKTFREAAVEILKAFAQRAAPSYVPQSEGGASISDETRKIESGLSLKVELDGKQWRRMKAEGRKMKIDSLFLTHPSSFSLYRYAELCWISLPTLPTGTTAPCLRIWRQLDDSPEWHMRRWAILALHCLLWSAVARHRFPLRLRRKPKLRQAGALPKVGLMTECRGSVFAHCQIGEQPETSNLIQGSCE